MSRRPHSWGRSEKYHARPRHLYALVFQGAVYIGQTVDLGKREAQHRSLSGGWNGRRFDVVPLGVCNGTHAQAAAYERAWRLAARRLGWKVYGLPPDVVVDPRRQASWGDVWRSYSLRWPGETKRGWWARMGSAYL